MKHEESNILALLVGVGIGWLGFTAEGQELIRGIAHKAKDKYIIKPKEEQEVKEDVQQ